MMNTHLDRIKNRRWVGVRLCVCNFVLRGECTCYQHLCSVRNACFFYSPNQNTPYMLLMAQLPLAYFCSPVRYQRKDILSKDISVPFRLSRRVSFPHYRWQPCTHGRALRRSNSKQVYSNKSTTIATSDSSEPSTDRVSSTCCSSEWNHGGKGRPVVVDAGGEACARRERAAARGGRRRAGPVDDAAGVHPHTDAVQGAQARLRRRCAVRYNTLFALIRCCTALLEASSAKLPFAFSFSIGIFGYMFLLGCISSSRLFIALMIA